ncbi:MAG: Hsp20/alpha crystallin family protein [Desulfotalea sp.]
MKNDLKCSSETNQTMRIPRLSPKFDILENDNEVLLVADMPGLIKDEIKVEIVKDKLEISGTRKANDSAIKGWHEFSGVEYYTLFILPQDLDREGIKAEYSQGVLTLHLARKEATKPQKITIH